MPLPPGIEFLLPRLPFLLAPPVSAYLISRAIGQLLDIPTTVVVVVCLWSWPLSLTLSTYWPRWCAQRRAMAAGAVMPPMVDYKMPGGLDLVRELLEDREKRYLSYRYMEQVMEYGYTYRISILWQDPMVTTEPAFVKAMLATDFDNYEKGSAVREQMRSLLGTGVFVADGDLWKFHRNISRPFFSKERISHFDVFDRHATQVIKLIKKRMQEGHAVDFQDLVARFTLDSATEFLFGKDLMSLEAPLPYPSTSGLADTQSNADHPANRFARSFLRAQELSSRRSSLTYAWPLWEFWRNKVDEHIETMDEFIEPLLQEAMSKKRHNKGSESSITPQDETMLQHLVNSTDDYKVIRDETVNILLAGRDTTAITLTMCIYNLSQHPDVLRRLREEVLSAVGTGRPTYEDIKEMKYLRAFIDEVLRLYPPVPFNSRFTKNDTVWPSPTPGGKPLFIPGNTRVFYNTFIIHRRKDLWGPDALEFDPDRFLDERLAKYVTPNPFIFLPFNAGPRICLGQQFAYNEISFMLIRLLQQVVEIRLVQEVHPEAVPQPGWAQSKFSNGKDKAVIRGHLTMYVAGGLWVEMKTVDDA
ncbi:cytochrom P450 [Cytidiella melzeri]|nr:cytochrom P450 [Cytidiella melzeri]